MINKQRLVKTFIELVRIDSLSYQEGKVMAYLRKELRQLGLRPYEAGKPAGGEVGNLAVDLPGSGPRVIINAHVDTVAPGKGIRPVVRGDRIYSNGRTILGADDKAGVAVILEMLKVLKEKKLPHPNLRIILTVAEEVGLWGAKAVPKRLLKADFGLTLDHGDIERMINQAPSQIDLQAVIIGRAAHAGIHPERGISSIQVASAAIAKMKLGRIDRETTANIGLISGGRATNIIPDRVELKGEARSHDPRKLTRQVEHMEKTLRRACARNGARLQLELSRSYQSFRVSPRTKVAKVVTKAVRALGFRPRLIPTGGGSDANIFNAAGLPTLNIGVGMHQVHTTKEFASIRQMVLGTALLLRVVGEVSGER